MDNDPPTLAEARMIRDIMQASEDVLNAWDSPGCEVKVSRSINQIYQRYGRAGLCGLTSQLIRASVPPEMKKELHRNPVQIVSPILLDDAEEDDGACGECDDCKNYECMNSVMQYMAAVIAEDPDMAIAIFKANTSKPSDERSTRWLSLVISTACNTRFSLEEPDSEFHM